MPKTVPETITTLRELGFTVANIADMLGVSIRQVHRWHTVVSSPNANDRGNFEDLNHILLSLYDAGHDDDQVLGWFMRRHPDLAQRRYPTPFLALKSGDFDRIVRLAEKATAPDLDGISA